MKVVKGYGRTDRDGNKLEFWKIYDKVMETKIDAFQKDMNDYLQNSIRTVMSAGDKLDSTVANELSRCLNIFVRDEIVPTNGAWCKAIRDVRGLTKVAGKSVKTEEVLVDL